MASGYCTVVAVRPTDKMVEFYGGNVGDPDSITTYKKQYRSRLFDSEFFIELRSIFEAYMNDHPSIAGQASQVVFAVPDFNVATDMLTFPVMGKKSMSNLFDVAIEQRYKNYELMQINQSVVMQNKQYTMIALASMRQSLLGDLNAACAESNMVASFSTSSGNLAVAGAVTLDSNLQGGSYVLLDIEELHSELCYVAQGTCLGCVQLPFGVDLLRQPKVIADNMLFEHSVSELAVLNAKEKAKAKQLTMMGEENPNNGEGGEGAGEGAVDEEASFSFVGANSVDRGVVQTVKSLPKKQPRVVPKWMQRPVPTSEQELVYENFRSFEKAAFEFIVGNSTLVNACAPDNIVVNIPKEYEYLLAMTNASQLENKYEMVALEPSDSRELITRNLSLYGGFYAESLPALNLF